MSSLIMAFTRGVPYNNASFVLFCRELAPGTVNLKGDWVHVDDSKQNSCYALQAPLA